MSAGKPFIASDVDGLHEITTGAGILFEDGNAQELADVLMKLKTDKEYAQTVAEACLKRARQYDISKTVDAYEALYKSII